MCTHIFMAAETDPTVMIGGTLPLLRSGYRVGKGDTIILESCEYCNSFLSFFPTVAVILNVEADHLDFFKDLQDIQNSFRRFAELVPPGGSVIVNADNAGAREAAQGLNAFTFGLETEAECTAMNLHEDRGPCGLGCLRAAQRIQRPGRRRRRLCAGPSRQGRGGGPCRLRRSGPAF